MNMVENIFDKIRKAITEAGNVELVKFDVKSLSEEDVFAISTSINTTLASSALKNELRPYKSSPKYMHLVWQDPENVNVNGEISLYNPLLALITATHNLSEWSNIPVKESHDSKCFRVEDRPYMGDGCLTLLSWDKMSDYKIFYRSDYILFELIPSFTRYCETLSLTMGYVHWQFLLCPDIDSEYYDFYKKKYQIELVKRVPELFPSINKEQLKNIIDQF